MAGPLFKMYQFKYTVNNYVGIEERVSISDRY
jgi:hypothetical protein